MANFTSYEVGLFKAGSLVSILGYTQRKTKSAVFGYCTINVDKLKALMTEADLDTNLDWKAGRLHMGSVSVGFTGGTKKFPTAI